MQFTFLCLAFVFWENAYIWAPIVTYWCNRTQNGPGNIGTQLEGCQSIFMHILQGRLEVT